MQIRNNLYSSMLLQFSSDLLCKDVACVLNLLNVLGVIRHTYFVSLARNRTWKKTKYSSSKNFRITLGWKFWLQTGPRTNWHWSKWKPKLKEVYKFAKPQVLINLAKLRWNWLWKCRVIRVHLKNQRFAWE